MAPSRQRNGTTGGKKNLTVSCDETKQRLPEEDHSPITSARSNDWAECRNKKVSAPSRRRDMSLDISFYRLHPRSTFRCWHRFGALPARLQTYPSFNQRLPK